MSLYVAARLASRYDDNVGLRWYVPGMASQMSYLFQSAWTVTIHQLVTNRAASVSHASFKVFCLPVGNSVASIVLHGAPECCSLSGGDGAKLGPNRLHAYVL